MNIIDILFAKKLGGGSPFPPVIKRVTGNPVEFTDGADAPLVKCVTEIQGSQDLHGQDKPWVGGAGKNKVSSVESWTIGSNGEIISYAGYKAPIAKIESGKTYIFSINGVASIPQTYAFYSSFPTAGSISYDGTRVIPSAYTFTAPIDGYIVARYADTVDDKIQLELGSTATSYEPYSNICPIVAYNQNTISVSGKNLFDYTKGENISAWQNGVSINFTPSNIRIVALGGKVKNGETYTFSFPSGVKLATMFYYENDTLPLNQGSGGIVGTNISVENASGVYTFTATETNYVYYYFAPTEGQTTLPISTLSTAQFEKGSTVTPYEPYTSTTHTTTYPNAIYRGSEDCVKGTETHDRKYIDSNITSITRGSLDSSGLLYRVYNNSDIKTDSNQNPIFLICNKYDVVGLGRCREKASNGEKSCCSYGSTIYIGGYVGSESDLDTELLTIQFAYETEPSTSSVTPTNLPIKSLSGYNHIESSTGDMTIDYITEGYQNFVDTVESALPNTRKGGVKAFDIFKTLDEPKTPEAPAEEKQEEEVLKK